MPRRPGEMGARALKGRHTYPMPVRQVPSSGRQKPLSHLAQMFGLAGPEVQKDLDQSEREQLSDRALIIQMPPEGSPKHEMEMQRRLKDAVEALTGELVTFRQSSEAAAEKADAAAGKLTTLTGWLIGFTIELVILTVVVVILTARLLAKG